MLRLWVDYSVEGTYHIGGSEVDMVNDTLFVTLSLPDF
jgi:hypothetical protein